MRGFKKPPQEVTFDQALQIFSNWRKEYRKGGFDKASRYLEEEEYDGYMAELFMSDLSKLNKKPITKKLHIDIEA